MVLTEDEHHTRAMLLGMEYDEQLSIYQKSNSKQLLDADTMEPISDDEFVARVINTLDDVEIFNQKRRVLYGP